MLDIKRIRENTEQVKAAAAAKRARVDIDRILERDDQRRELLSRVEALKAERNAGSKEVGRLKKAGEDSSDLEARMRAIGEEIKGFDAEVTTVTAERDHLMAYVPNVPAADVPEGDDASGNVEVRSHGEKPSFAFEPKPHWDIGADLGILDQTRREDLGRRVHPLPRAGREARASVVQLHARSAYHRARLHGVPAAVSGQPRLDVWHGAAAEARGGHVPPRGR